MDKFQELQEKLVDAAKKANLEAIESLKSEIDELKKISSRFQLAPAGGVNSLKEAASLIANHPDLSRNLKSRKGSYTVTIPGNPYDLAKSVTYNPGNQTISGDIRRVLASEDRPGINLLPLRPPAIRDLLTVVPTSAEFINWVAETSTTNDAAYVNDAAEKPESDVALVVKRQPVETIAHWIQVPLQLAADVNSFQSYLEQRLVDMLRVKSEDAYLYGNGSAPNLLGITAFPGIQTYSQVTGENRIDAIRQALNVLEGTYYPWADAIVCHPTDIMRMELLKDSQDRYLWPLFGRWSEGYNNKSLFGVPVVSTTALTEGTFLVGNFKYGATLYQRQDVTVDVSMDDRDNFIKNLMTIRVESRECLVPEYAKAFCLGTFLGASYD